MQPSKGVTLKFVAAVAAACYRLRLALLVTGLVAAGWFVFSLTSFSAESALALLPLTIVLWVALALGMGYTLSRLPPAILPGDRLGRRIWVRLSQVGYGLAIVVMLGLTAFSLFMSFRAFQLIFV